PASTSFFMWWLTVGWLMPSGSVRSHAQTESHPWATTRERSRRRVGSDSAFSTEAIRSASALPTGPADSVQHSPGPAIGVAPGSVGAVVVGMPPPYIDSHRCEA